MNSYIMRIASTFRFIDKSLPSAFFIRHGEKLASIASEDDEACLLSQTGKRNSYNLGILLREKIGTISSIISSPVQRCVTTGQMLVKGNQSSLSIQENSMMRHAYVRNPTEARDSFLQLKMSDIVKKQIKGEILRGFIPIEEGTQNLLSFVLPHLKKTQLNIYITHDLLLTTFFFSLTQMSEIKVEEEWFDYLDGICLQWFPNDKLRIYRGMQAFDVDIITSSC